MTVNKQYIRAHIHDLHGYIPAPGTEWQFRETEMTKEQHQSHIQYLKEEDGGLTKVRSDRWGVYWQTEPQLADALRTVADDMELDPEGAVVAIGQTDFGRFGRASG